MGIERLAAESGDTEEIPGKARGKDMGIESTAGLTQPIPPMYLAKPGARTWELKVGRVRSGHRTSSEPGKARGKDMGIESEWFLSSISELTRQSPGQGHGN